MFEKIPSTPVKVADEDFLPNFYFDEEGNQVDGSSFGALCGDESTSVPLLHKTSEKTDPVVHDQGLEKTSDPLEINTTKHKQQEPIELDEEEEIIEYAAPDGGYAWCVLFASIMVNILIPGTVKSFGILFVEFMEVFEATQAEAAWIPAISFFLYSSTSPFASALAIRFSDRLVTVIGGILAAAGLCLSYFADSVIFLCLSYGVIGGLGSGLAYPIGVFIVSRYFDKKRGLANGLCTSGSAMGAVLMPHVLQFLLSNYGYRKAIFICGCLLLNVCLVALFYDPVEKHLKQYKRTASTKSLADLNKNCEMKSPTITNIRNDSSVPIPIPKRPMFEIGHDTPKGGGSWSPTTSIEGNSPIVTRLSKDEVRTKFQYNNSSLSPSVEPPSIRSTNQSKINLSAIMEDEDDRVDWNFYRGLPLAKQRLFGFTTNPIGSGTIQGHTPPPTHPSFHSQRNMSQHFSQGDDRYLCRTLSVISNASTSSFHYISTIHHGPLLTSIQYDENVNPVQRSHSQTITSKNFKDEIESCTEVTKSNVKGRKLFDFTLLQSPFFIIFLLSCATTAVSYTNFIVLLPAYAHEKGFLKSEASYLLSTVAALDFVGRIGGAGISDLKFVSRHWFFVMGIFCSGITLTLFPLCTTFTSFAVLCACFGVCSGTYIGVTAVILADRLGPQRLGSSFSICLFLNGILQLCCPPICGIVSQTLKTNEPILISLGLLLMLGASLWIAVPFLKPEEPYEVKFASSTARLA